MRKSLLEKKRAVEKLAVAEIGGEKLAGENDGRKKTAGEKTEWVRKMTV